MVRHWGHVATGVRDVATAEELTAALDDPELHHIRVTEDLKLAREIVIDRSTPLVVEGACGGGTRGCSISPARDAFYFTDVWGNTCFDWRGYCGVHSPSYIDVCPVPSAVAPDGSTCEVGGYIDISGYYYSKAHMDEVRSRCSVACAVLLGSGSSDSTRRLLAHDVDYEYVSENQCEDQWLCDRETFLLQEAWTDVEDDELWKDLTDLWKTQLWDSVAQIRFFDVSLRLRADEELTFIGLTFTGGKNYNGVGHSRRVTQRICFSRLNTKEPADIVLSGSSLCRTAVR